MCWKHGLSEVRAQAAGLGEMVQVPATYLWDWCCQIEVTQETEGTTYWCFQLGCEEYDMALSFHCVNREGKRHLVSAGPTLSAPWKTWGHLSALLLHDKEFCSPGVQEELGSVLGQVKGASAFQIGNSHPWQCPFHLHCVNVTRNGAVCALGVLYHNNYFWQHGLSRQKLINGRGEDFVVHKYLPFR